MVQSGRRNASREGGVVAFVLLAGEERELLEETEDARRGVGGCDRRPGPLAFLDVSDERPELGEDLRVRGELGAEARVVLEPPTLADQRFGLAGVLLEHSPVESAPVDAGAPLQGRGEVLVDELRHALLVLAERVAAAGPDATPHGMEQAGLQVGARRRDAPAQGRDGGRPGGDIDQRSVRADLPDIGVVLARLETPRLDDPHPGHR